MALKTKESAGVYEPIGLHDWVDEVGVNAYNLVRFFEGVYLGLKVASFSMPFNSATRNFKPSPLNFKPIYCSRLNSFDQYQIKNLNQYESFDQSNTPVIFLTPYFY